MQNIELILRESKRVLIRQFAGKIGVWGKVLKRKVYALYVGGLRFNLWHLKPKDLRLQTNNA